MDHQLFLYAKKQIKQAFPKYKRIQAGATLIEVIVNKKKRVWEGFYYRVEHREETIKMVKFKRVHYEYYLGITRELHQVYVAVDQRTKTVYWNFERIT